MAIVDLSEFTAVRQIIPRKRWSTTYTYLWYYFIRPEHMVGLPKEVDWRDPPQPMFLADFALKRVYNRDGHWDNIDPAYAFKDKLLLTEYESKAERKFRHNHRNFTGSLWLIEKDRATGINGSNVLVLDRKRLTHREKVFHKLGYDVESRP